MCGPERALTREFRGSDAGEPTRMGGGQEKASVVVQGVCSRPGMCVKGPGLGRVVWSGILASFKKTTLHL